MNKEQSLVYKIVDCIPGAGKTQSSIRMINEASGQERFIFITPYKTEVERVLWGCRAKNFKTPPDIPYPYGYVDGQNKLSLLNELLREKENIVSTHSLFMRATDETKALIKAGGYTLILDEVLDIFQECSYLPSDVKLLIDSSVMKVDKDGIIRWVYEGYDDGLFKQIKEMSEVKNLITTNSKEYYWMLPMDIFKCFSNGYILTYMFEHSPLRCCMEGAGIPYKYIGSKRRPDGQFEFCKAEEMSRAVDLKSKIHIIKNDRRNNVGDKKTDLSLSWFQKSVNSQDGSIDRLKSEIYNSFRYDMPNTGKKLWSTFKDIEDKLKGKGYTKSFITFNQRATNEYKDRDCLAYCLNVFINPNIHQYLNKICENKINQDMWSLSNLIQWLFRSKIREGGEVWLYVPSKRMRYLLEEWLNNLVVGDDLKPINYNAESKRRKIKKTTKKNKGG